MDITSETRTVDQLVPISGSDSYFIPLYQRNYSWKPDQIDQLFNDIRYEDENYYVGNLLVVPHEQQGKNVSDAYDVIDGQQRLTTISLFLLAIWQRAEEISNNENTSKSDVKKTGTIQWDIERRLILNPEDEDPEPRLHLLEEDDIVYRSLLCVFGEQEPKRIGRTAFAKRYRYIRKLFGADTFPTISELDKFYEKLLKVTILRIHVPDITDAFNVFSSMNSKGLPLTLVDLLKAEFISDAGTYLDRKAEETTEQWMTLSETLSRDGEPDTTITTQFLLNNWDAFESEDNRSITKGSALKLYRGRIRQFYSDKRSDYLSILQERASIYAQVLCLPNHEYPDQTIAKRLKALVQLESTQSYPLLMELLEDSSLELGDVLPQILDYLIAFYVRRNITLVPKSSNIRARIIRLTRELKQHKYTGEAVLNLIRNGEGEIQGLNTISVDDNVLRSTLCAQGIYDKNKATTRFILIDLERRLPGEGIVSKAHPDTFDDFINDKTRRWSIEHILPEGNLPDTWNNAISPDNPDQAKEIQAECVHLIGNLTLTPYNSELGQRTFDEKKRYKDPTSSDITGLAMPLKINVSIPDVENGETLESKTTWTADDIKRRSAWFADKIAQLYSLN
ncbi:DUF262 domain-containing HNH endonuclease family protein [uncultured Bifidobacterium sp.]|uniref:DUF262 domain-containing protein n=1 Tax=uncultured Bifidobacterium sp. TaxID=165187 RepID=UPI00258C07E0|nr:DUF262 domain-containing HNH endonuclease family protein [uncultured Bifidobacterium sp.]